VLWDLQGTNQNDEKVEIQFELKLVRGLRKVIGDQVEGQ